MGSKHSLLSNGLGQLIVKESQRATRIVDLFCGGSSIAWFAAENTKVPVLATDLQQYAVVLAKSVLGRTTILDPERIALEWFRDVLRIRDRSRTWREAKEHTISYDSMAEYVEESRKLCSSVVASGSIWRSYGGHYFSPSQAATIDAMIEALPQRDPFHTVCLAATIAVGSHCAASPGHTAQPFQPTSRAAPYIEEAWARNPLDIARKALEQVCSRRATMVGEAYVGEAVQLAATLSSSDLVIVDPPYSGVQYSRFYHVLETIATGADHPVSGTGRYPPITARAQSSFSRLSESKNALISLLENLSRVQATVIFTFPAGESSNGLSGEVVVDVARNLFNVEEHRVQGRFSTLGGNNMNRLARSKSEELVLVMRSCESS